MRKHAALSPALRQLELVLTSLLGCLAKRGERLASEGGALVVLACPNLSMDNDVDAGAARPEVFEIDPARSVFVGDSPSDAGAAKAAGMRSVGCLYGANEAALRAGAGFDRVVEDVAGLAAALRDLGSVSYTHLTLPTKG